ncbi:MAG: HD domain-containing protein [Oscillospiraceae bacterium]|nr:HD domain-containing protein [Oscillospiraceae bacterium]
MDQIDQLMREMVVYDGGDPHRVQHFLKVHSFSRFIGHGEDVDPQTLFTLEAAALVHDIGIRAADEKYGRHEGPLQEKEGAPIARQLLSRLGFSDEVTGRVSYLVGRHHTYSEIDGLDYQILVEADFLVNLFEGGSSREAILAAYRKIFRTGTGKALCREMFALGEEGL